jgi:hypothetical protein
VFLVQVPSTNPPAQISLTSGGDSAFLAALVGPRSGEKTAALVRVLAWRLHGRGGAELLFDIALGGSRGSEVPPALASSASSWGFSSELAAAAVAESEDLRFTALGAGIPKLAWLQSPHHELLVAGSQQCLCLPCGDAPLAHTARRHSLEPTGVSNQLVHLCTSGASAAIVWADGALSWRSKGEWVPIRGENGSVVRFTSSVAAGLLEAPGGCLLVLLAPLTTAARTAVAMVSVLVDGTTATAQVALARQPLLVEVAPEDLKAGFALETFAGTEDSIGSVVLASQAPRLLVAAYGRDHNVTRASLLSLAPKDSSHARLEHITAIRGGTAPTVLMRLETAKGDRFQSTLLSCELPELVLQVPPPDSLDVVIAARTTKSPAALEPSRSPTEPSRSPTEPSRSPTEPSRSPTEAAKSLEPAKAELPRASSRLLSPSALQGGSSVDTASSPVASSPSPPKEADRPQRKAGNPGEPAMAAPVADSLREEDERRSTARGGEELADAVASRVGVIVADAVRGAAAETAEAAGAAVAEAGEDLVARVTAATAPALQAAFVAAFESRLAPALQAAVADLASQVGRAMRDAAKAQAEVAARQSAQLKEAVVAATKAAEMAASSSRQAAEAASRAADSLARLESSSAQAALSAAQCAKAATDAMAAAREAASCVRASGVQQAETGPEETEVEDDEKLFGSTSEDAAGELSESVARLFGSAMSAAASGAARASSESPPPDGMRELEQKIGQCIAGHITPSELFDPALELQDVEGMVWLCRTCEARGSVPARLCPRMKAFTLLCLIQQLGVTLEDHLELKLHWLAECAKAFPVVAERDPLFGSIAAMVPAVATSVGEALRKVLPSINSTSSSASTATKAAATTLRSFVLAHREA